MCLNNLSREGKKFRYFFNSNFIKNRTPCIHKSAGGKSLFFPTKIFHQSIMFLRENFNLYDNKHIFPILCYRGGNF